MFEYNLEPIVEWNMNEKEASAYKLGLLWIEIVRRIFPNARHTTGYPKKGDPRKGSLFKHCYTLLTQLKDRVEPKDYKFYVAAQLQIFKSIEINGQHPLITPACLLGDKAWTRWKLWKKKYENIGKVKTVENVGIDKIDIQKVKNELLKSKKFLKFSNEEEFKNSSKAVEQGIILGRISSFYAVLSPWAKRYCNLSSINLTYYEENINSEIQSFFKENFEEN